MSRLGRLAPPLALMGLIFFLSAQPDLKSGLGVIDLIARKIIHTGEYALLWWLWLRALRYERPWLAVVITMAYAATDEFHQHFVSGRIASPLDWAIDGVGVAVAFWLWRRLVHPAAGTVVISRAKTDPGQDPGSGHSSAMAATEDAARSGSAAG